MASLALLQNRMKRQPEAYVDDFARQLAHFEAMRTLLLEQTTPQTSKEAAKQFGKLAAFLAAVASCFPEKGGKRVPDLIISLLDSHASQVTPDLRMKLLQSLILLRVKGLLGPERLIETCFALFRVRDKPFRAALYSYIVKDVRVINKVRTNVELNRSLQSLVFKMLSDDERTAGTPAAAKRALSVVIELYKRRVWIDARAVNVVADACFSRIPRNAVAAARFFLGIDDEIDDLLTKDDDDEDDGNPMNVGTKKDERTKKLRASLMAPKVSKQTKSKTRKRNRIKSQLKKLDSGKETVVGKSSESRRIAAPRFPAIDLIHDPHNFAERLLKTVRTSTERFEIRLVQLNLISRVIGHHKLLLFPFYSFCQRYLQPHHESVNAVLASVIQASHSLVPPEEMDPIVKVLANNFINDRTGSEVMAVGLNSIREIISRVPLVTEGEGMKDLISDLIAYRKYRRDRSVIIAARSLLLELRRINPRVLAAKERGKFHDLSSKPLEYGEQVVSDGVDGVDLLEEWLARQAEADVELDEEGEEDEDGQNDDEVEEDIEGSDEEWQEEDLENEVEEEEGEDEDDDTENSPEQESSQGNGPSAKGAKRLKRMDAERMLTDDDFKKIRALKKLEAEGKIKKNVPGADGKKVGKLGIKQGKLMGYTLVPSEEADDEENEMQTEHTFEVDSLGTDDEEDEEEEAIHDPSIVDPASLDGIKKKNRRELAEKLKEIQTQNAAKKAKKSSRIVNNTEKAKRTKDFLMVQKSRTVRKKQTMSIREQQAQVSKHMKTLQKKSKLLTKLKRRG